jgi:hypothetical protein
MKAIIKLTDQNNDVILIGIESIIVVTTITRKEPNKVSQLTKIQSRGAMITTNYVLETIDEIYKMINS